ncbi:tRNA pseudouridine synthase 4 [Lecanosticta acicola]|uniref:tRNA pseudouridine(55) synthase n=1 Tax=Lecanosticta acicola TaxID=111012 RepID=A0AAI9EF97_9PEZI|nr:tRNA pseudouridine synthase 4 [Lecanosticta acicola]
MSSSDRIFEGVMAINKPSGITSAQVIRDAQKHFNPSKLFQPWLAREQAKRDAESGNQKQKRRWRGRRETSVKMGHGGTLDPMATGVLILGIGSGTKQLNHFTTECTKSYETTVLFGAATDSYDTEGKIVGRKPYEHITKEMVEEALQRFKGKGMQKPPIFSAIRVQGKRLYEYAREGKEVPVEIEQRPVEVSELEMTEWYEGGTHKWHWPKEEADTAQKTVAQKVLHIGGDDEDPIEAGDAEAPAAAKRKRVDQDENGPAPKKPKEESSAHQTTPDNAPEPAPSDVAKDGEASPEPIAKPIAEQSADAPVKPDNEGHLEKASEQQDPKQDQTAPDRSPCPAPACRIRMTVTSGFYVRSLCHDLGAALGSLGIMASLVRTRQGDFELGKNVLQYEELQQGEDAWAPRVQEMLEQSANRDRE